MSDLPASRRILLLANETCAGARVVEEVRYRAGPGPAEVRVVAPALASSRMQHWLSSRMNERIAAATRRIQQSVDALRAAGLSATGDVGDADPLQALDDAMRVFEPDEVIISTHPPGRSIWIEERVVQRARERLDIPVTHIVVDVEQSALSSVSRSEGRRRRARSRQVMLFHAAPYQEALRIRARGFDDLRDMRESPTPGVLLTDRPPRGGSENDPLVFGVRLPEDVVDRFEATGPGDDVRRFLVPAGLVNQMDPPELVSETASE